MQGGFRNPLTVIPIADGAVTSVKLASTLQSDNFVTGVSGWRIRRDTGDAEFNSITVRGTIYATAGEIGGLTVNGNLTMGAGGVFRSASSGQRIQITSADDDRIAFYTGHASETTPGYIIAELATGGLQLKSPNLGSGVGTILLTDTATFQTDAVWFPDGTAGNPGLSFEADSDTGLVRVDANTIGVSLGGTVRARFAPSAYGIGGLSSSASAPFIAPNALTSGDTDSGYYGVSDGITAISGNGNIIMVFDSPNTDIRAGIDNTFNLGNSGFRFVDVWAIDTTINSSDAREKKFIKPFQFDSLELINSIPARQFVRRGRKRIHTGFIAQEVESGLNAMRLELAMLIRGEDSKQRMGLRTGEMVAILWDAIQKLDARLTALEVAA